MGERRCAWNESGPHPVLYLSLTGSEGTVSEGTAHLQHAMGGQAPAFMKSLQKSTSRHCLRGVYGQTYSRATTQP